MSEINNYIILKGTDNYALWFNYLCNELRKEGLLHYIKENVLNNVDIDNPPNDKKEQIKKDAKVVSKILNTININIHREIVGLNTSYEIISKLKKKYGSSTTDSSYWLKKLNSIKTTNKQGILDVIDQLKDIFENMDNINFHLSEDEKLRYLFNAMPEDYTNKFTLTDIDNFTSISKKIVEDINKLAYIQQWNLNNQPMDDPMEIDYAGKFQKKNKNNNKRNYQTKKADKKYCHICNKNNHNTSDCWFNALNKNSKFNKYVNQEYSKEENTNNSKSNNNNQSSSKKKGKGTYYTGIIKQYNINEQYNANVDYEDIKIMFKKDTNKSHKSVYLINYKNNASKVLKNISSINFYDKSYWLYDSGAGEHLTNNKNLLKNYKKEEIELTCANNTVCTFEGYGEFSFFINNYKIILKRVLYSKDVAKNMISGVELAKLGIKTLTESINNDTVKITLMDNLYKTIGSFVSNSRNELIITAIHDNSIKENIKNNIMAINKLNNESKLLWHRRLGHYYLENLNEYLDIHNIKESECIDCKIAKLKRFPHNKETPKATEILEIIHSDIIGPINDSITGKRFILTVIDEKSHKSWIFLMKSKSETIDLLIDFIKYLNNIFNDKKVKNFKSDNAKEYRNKKLTRFCKDNGINKIYSPPYNPENNGLAERFNQTIISCTKTLLYWSKLSENFWDFAIQYANYLYNKTPHLISEKTIPDEVFFNEKVKIDHIRTFGCITYYKIFDQNKSKFSPNSKKGIFLGFSEVTNSNIVMDYEDYKIHNVREIICKENEPAKLSLSNSVGEENGYPSFLNFDFNFSKTNRIKSGTILNFPGQNDHKNLDSNSVENENKNISEKENSGDINNTDFNTITNTKNDIENTLNESHNNDVNKNENKMKKKSNIEVTQEKEIEDPNNFSDDEFFDAVDEKKFY